MASSIDAVVIIGRIGPKISSYISGESCEGLRITVGVRFLSL